MQGIFFVAMGHSIGESHQIVTEMDIFHYKAVVKKTEIKVAEIPYSLYAGFYNLRGYILRRLPVSAYNYNINGVFFTKIFYPAYGLYLKANKMIAHQGVIIVKNNDNAFLCRKFELIFVLNMLQCILAAATVAARKIAKF